MQEPRGEETYQGSDRDRQANNLAPHQTNILFNIYSLGGGETDFQLIKIVYLFPYIQNKRVRPI
jgi:hypothetical protein